MKLLRTHPGLAANAALLVAAGGLACSTYEMKHEIQWNSREQIWLSEASQVKLRSAQSRVFDTSDRLRALEAVVSAFQDLDFQILVLDDVLGVVSGVKLIEGGGAWRNDPYYNLYDAQTLLVMARSYRTWGPFMHRSDAVRLTVTLRARNESQLIVRASAQYFLRAVESPEPYQKFFRTLAQAMFLEAQLAP
jgi:hypothetical protein